MFSYMRKKFSSDSNRKKSRTKSNRKSKNLKASSGGRKLLNKTLSSFSDVISSVENIPHNVDVAQWILGVETPPVFNSGFRPISPPVPVRSSSRLAVSPQNISALKKLLHSNGYSSPKMYGTAEKKSKQISKQVNVNNSKDKSKIKSSKSTAHKQSKNAPKVDTKTISKSKRTPTQHRNKSVSPQLKSGERYGWQYINVMLNRVSTYGLGIAVSGGTNNPHFADGDPSIVISDILKSGPAEGKLKINDRVISVNGISLENVDYSSALQVLRESGNSVNLLIKRRVVMHNKPSDTFRVTLTKNKRKDDFGVVLGCKLFVKEITNRKLIEKNTSIQEGDYVLKLNHTITDDLSLKEVKKLVEGGKNKLRLVIKREPNNRNNTFNELSQSPRMSPNTNLYDNLSAINNRLPNWTNQNIYAQTPLNTKGRANYSSKHIDDKNNLNRLQQQQQLLQQQLGEYGRISEQPLTDMTYSHFNQTVTPPTLTAHSKTSTFPADNLTPPPRPPPPTHPRPMNVADNERPQQIPDFTNQPEIKTVSTEPRLISFQKDSNGFGIRIAGGNQSGIFVSAVNPSSLASLHGLQVGDKILKINNTSMKGLTREEAVTFLYRIEKQIYLIVQHIKEEYNDMIVNRKNDSFYVRVYFNYDTAAKGEIAFRCGEVFHVIDTVYNDCIGLWLAWRLTRITNQEIEIGVIPNQVRAEKYAMNALNKKVSSDANDTSSSRGNIFRRSFRKVESNNAEDKQSTYEMSEVLFAYERVVLKQPNFIRPVVIFGPIADIAREKLVKDYPDCYELPRIYSNELKVKKEETNISLSAIKEVIHKEKHALLTITPNDVQRLNYEQLYPIVILLTAQNKLIVKELRSDLPKSMRKNSRKLFDDAVECEKLWSHVFTETITVKSRDDMWYDTLRESIEMQQLSSIWMSEFKCKKDFTDDDDTLFPIMSSRENSDNDIIGKVKYRDKDAENWREMLNESFNTSISSEDKSSKLKLSAAYEKLDRDLYFHSPIDDYSRLTFPDIYYSSADSRNQNIGYKKFMNKVVELPPSVDRITKPSRFRRDTPNFFESQEHEKPAKYSALSLASSSSRHNYIPITSKPAVHRDSNYIYGNSFLYANDYSNFGIDYKQRYDSVVKQLSPSAKYVNQIQRSDTPPPPLPPPPIILSPPSPKMFNYYPVQSMSANRRHLPFIKHYDTQGLSDESDEPIVCGMNQLQLNESFGYFVSANKAQPQSVRTECDDNASFNDGNAIYSYSTFRPQMSNESVSTQTFDDSKHNVIATARGVFTSSGGVLISDKTEVCLVIPENAIPEGIEQEIYFKVCRYDTSMAPPLDREKGETLLSPIVMCGPHGLHFEKPVELRLPHCVSGNADSWSFALKSSDTSNGMQWQNVNLETKDGKQSANSVVDNNFISVLVDHF